MARLTALMIEELKDETYNRFIDRKVKTEEDAIEFINNVGFCSLQKNSNLKIPSLWVACFGERFPEIKDFEHKDPMKNFIWNLKYTLLEQKKAFYGNVMYSLPSFISIEYLPFFYVIYGIRDEEQHYKDSDKTNISHLCLSIIELLKKNGKKNKNEIKKNLNNNSENSEELIDSALEELQNNFIIVCSEMTYEPEFLKNWDLFENHFSNIKKEAENITEDIALEKILIKHFHNNYITTKEEIQEIFMWKNYEIDKIIDILIEKRIIIPNYYLDKNKIRFYALSKIREYEKKLLRNR